MGVAWGLVVIALSLLAWGGQALSWAAPTMAEWLSLTEQKDHVEPVYHADIRGEPTRSQATTTNREPSLYPFNSMTASPN